LPGAALVSARKVSTLAGIGDLLRVEQSVAAQPNRAAATVDLDYTPVETRNAPAWRLDVPSLNLALYATVRSPVRAARTTSPSDEILLFGPNAHRLTPRHLDLLAPIVDLALENPERKLQITGHTDSSGSAEYNRMLAERRVRSVVEYLERQGIPASRIQATSVGESAPRIRTGDGVREAGNRAVVVEFR
jgi:outer membrane protein OmpA-like peptidoglycan-associated protein